MKLTKRQKADIYAWVVNKGFWCYFDKCTYVPHLHKYRYFDGDESKVFYCSAKQFAHNFDTYFHKEEKEQFANEYFDDLNYQVLLKRLEG